MKAEPAHQIRLLDLQELDSRLARLRYRARNLPEAAETAELEQRVADLSGRLIAAQTRVSDLEREQRKAEADVDQVRARADRDTRRLESGQVGSPKELESLQSEIASLGRRQAELEEIVLEVMERGEAAARELRELRAERGAAEEELEALRRRLGESSAQIRKEEAQASEERLVMATEIPHDLLALYNKLREQYDGVGAAMLRYGRCEGCKLALSTAELADIRNTPQDEVVRCEDCRRILVRTPESGLNPAAAQ